MSDSDLLIRADPSLWPRRGRPTPREFLVEVLAIYDRHTARGGIVSDIAKTNRLPTSTVGRWVRVARQQVADLDSV